MGVLIQHGYGKGGKIQRALTENVAEGVILSPRDELPTSMRPFVRYLRSQFSRALLIFDPQFYATTIPDARDAKLPEYPYYKERAGAQLSDFRAREIPKIAKSVVDYQMGLAVDRILSPTVVLDSLGGRWAQVALYLAQESIAYCGRLQSPPPLLISLAVSQESLADDRAMDDILDELSSLNGAAGFYVVVSRSSAYSQRFDASQLAALMYLVYVLADVNRFEVICGYTDFVGTLLHACGARFCASGWSQNLRHFTRDRFLPVSGGSAPQPRYSSLPLLNTPLLSELSSCQEIGLLECTLSGSPYDAVITGAPTVGNAAWTSDISALHHWWTLQQAHRNVVGAAVGGRLSACSAALERAREVYARLKAQAIRLHAPATSTHLKQWGAAIAEFGAKVGL
jgi:hypothetical protein